MISATVASLYCLQCCFSACVGGQASSRAASAMCVPSWLRCTQHCRVDRLWRQFFEESNSGDTQTRLQSRLSQLTKNSNNTWLHCLCALLHVQLDDAGRVAGLHQAFEVEVALVMVAAAAACQQVPQPQPQPQSQAAVAIVASTAAPTTLSHHWVAHPITLPCAAAWCVRCSNSWL